MASLTAIELGADTCALARTSVRGGDVRLLDAVVLDPASFPGEQSYTVGMRHARRTAKLPRRARVVVWGLEEGSSAQDAALKPLLVPLANAGFRVERLVSPCDALAALARVRTPVGEGSTCWVAVNRGGVAIVVVRPGKQLYAHSFLWNSNVGATGSQARLLQRYSLVSFLSPEIKRGMQEARRQGTPISAVVTCGNLPDLRSLTMPLIEELDLEVETLDSLDGLSVSPPASDKLADIAPAIRLACAGAIARPTRSRGESKRATAHRAGAVLGAAAVVVAIAVVGYGWYRLRSPVTVSQVPLASTPSAIPSRPVKPPPP